MFFFDKVVQAYPFLRLGLLMIGGIVLGNALCGMVSAWWWLCAFVATWSASLAAVRWPLIRSGLLLGTVLLLGAWRMAATGEHIRTPLSEQYAEYEAVLMSEPRIYENTMGVHLLIVEGLEENTLVNAFIQLDTLHHREQRLHVGDGIRTRTRLRPVAADTPEDSRFKRWAETQGFRARTFIYNTNWEKAAVTLHSLSVWQRARLRALMWRNTLLAHLRSTVSDNQVYGVVAAMTLGDRSAISRDTRQLFSMAGGSHVLALSGLHLSILCSLLLLFLRRTNLLWLSHFLLLLAIWQFALLTGLSSSIVRSATMLSWLCMAKMMRRGSNGINTLFLAATLTLTASPLSLWDVSFQLSYLAVLSILLFMRFIHFLTDQKDSVRNIRPCWKNAGRFVAVSVAAQIGVAPLAAYYFESFPTYFLLTNMVVIPAAILIITLTLAFFLCPIATVQQAIGYVLEYIVGTSCRWLQGVSSLPGASCSVSSLTPTQVLMLYVMEGCLVGILAVFARRWAERHL